MSLLERDGSRIGDVKFLQARMEFRMIPGRTHVLVGDMGCYKFPVVIRLVIE